MEKVTFSRYDTADYLTTEEDIAAYLEAVAEDGNPALIAESDKIVARARARNAQARPSSNPAPPDNT
ncbi:helix-turn-helix domain-containing transcriptional regulator [Burkholderia sp. IMCC1007]|uniref:helix-turn-helix domain-containing transcriptional regulator n=1 Tax=Burkholderia sp. IMCC1007 TaxID=3004104 RepID=UPI0022B5E0A7|nr:hypothetical protein [Burkholderia sp. IMCC1007]